MTNIITNTEVFNFMKTENDVVTSEGTAITALITRLQAVVEDKMGRYIHSEDFSAILFQHNLNCEIYGQKLFLKGFYRDCYSISAITEEGSALSAVTDYDDSNDYYLDARKGIILRNENNWSQAPFAIKITGKMGMVNPDDDEPLEVWKEPLIELVAAKSGLWKELIYTDGGTIERIKTTLSKDAKAFFDLYTLKDM